MYLLKNILVFPIVIVVCLFFNNTALASLAPIAPNKILSIVIGNSDYQFVYKLQNPVRDAELMKKTFESLGHEVVFLKNASKYQILDSINKITRGTEYYDVIVFFYAGWGFGIGDRGYLMPIDAKSPQTILEAGTGSINLSLVLDSLTDNAGTVVGFFDASRNNPFADAEINPMIRFLTAQNTIQINAASPGKEPMDSLYGEENSPFTKSLSHALLENNSKEIEEIFEIVRLKVVEITNGEQVPFMSSSATNRVSLLGKVEQPIASGLPTKLSDNKPSNLAEDTKHETDVSVGVVMEEFMKVSKSNNVKEMVNILKKYPHDPQLEPYRNLIYQNLVEINLNKSKGGSPAKEEIPESSLLFEKGSRNAIVVGIDDYQVLPNSEEEPSKLHDLRFAESDAKNFANVLESGKMGVWQIKLLTGENANRSKVIRLIKRLLADSSPNDTVLIYFSGHGSSDKYDNDDVYLMLQDSTDDESESGLDFYTLKRMVERSLAKNIMVVIDACRSGNIGSGEKGNSAPGGFDQSLLTFTQQKHGKSRVLFTSSKANQSSWEDDRLNSGVFTHYLIKAIQGEAENSHPNQFVDLGEIESYTKKWCQNTQGNPTI